MIYLFLADGCEEVEALTTLDLLRRASVDVQTVSIMGRKNVVGSHNIEILADIIFEDLSGITDHMDSVPMLILPGGMPGTKHLAAHEGLQALIRKQAEQGGYLAAICAAPTVYGEMGLLAGRQATCYPGMEDGLKGALLSTESVVADGNYITSRGLGTAIDFGLKLIEILKGKELADDIADKIVYHA